MSDIRNIYIMHSSYNKQGFILQGTQPKHSLLEQLTRGNTDWWECMLPFNRRLSSTKLQTALNKIITVYKLQKILLCWWVRLPMDSSIWIHYVPLVSTIGLYAWHCSCYRFTYRRIALGVNLANFLTSVRLQVHSFRVVSVWSARNIKFLSQWDWSPVISVSPKGWCHPNLYKTSSFNVHLSPVSMQYIFHRWWLILSCISSRVDRACNSSMICRLQPKRSDESNGV